MSKFCKKCGCVVDDESQDYCWACLVDLEEKESVQNGSQPSIDTQQEKVKQNGIWLSTLIEIFAVLELIAGVILAFAVGFTYENVFIFFGFFIGGIISFIVLSALSVFVKAANKYLNS